MASISFLIITSDKTPKLKPVPIYVRLTDGRRTDLKVKTKYSILAEDWSKSKQEPKSANVAKYKKLKQDLIQLRSDLLEYYNNRVSGDVINTKWLKLFIEPEEKKGEVSDKVLDYLEYYINIKKDVTPNSKKKYNVIKGMLTRYSETLKEPLVIKDISPSFQSSFEAFCEKNHYGNNTIAFALKFIRNLCEHAGRNGIELNTRLRDVRRRTTEVTNIYLTEDELLKIKESTLTSAYLDNARDWLLISCYTGQRVSDFMRFNVDMIKEVQNKHKKTVKILQFKQKKTNKIIAVPLHDIVLEVINKNDGNFPKAISDQKYNLFIKKVCEQSGITEVVKGGKMEQIKKGVHRKKEGYYPKHELVTSHIGRRSFATNYYSKIPTSLLIAITGHSTESMFLRYIGKSSFDQAIELSDYFQ